MPPCPAPTLLAAAGPLSQAALLAALANYPPYYDESFDEIRARIAAAGSATKLDIGGLAAWKRLRCDTPWNRTLQHTPQVTVIAATQAAFLPGLTPVARVAALRGNLAGMGATFALGSALLTAWDMTNFAVTDRHARSAMRKLLSPLGCICEVIRYPTYLDHVISLRDLVNVVKVGLPYTARDVDKALYILMGRSCPRLTGTRALICKLVSIPMPPRWKLHHRTSLGSARGCKRADEG